MNFSLTVSAWPPRSVSTTGSSDGTTTTSDTDAGFRRKSTTTVVPTVRTTPCAYAGPVANNKQSESHVPLIGFISPPSVCSNFRAGSNLWPEYSLLGTPEASGCRTPAEPGRRRPYLLDLITICRILSEGICKTATTIDTLGF